MPENKPQPKFSTQFLQNKAPNDPQIEKLKYWCKEFDKHGLTPSYGNGSFGNLSFRTKQNNFIITASGLELKSALSQKDFVEVADVDLQNNIVYANGIKNPSSESILHYLIYKERKDINAIFHGHCQKILDNYKRLGLPITESEEPYGSVELAQELIRILDANNCYILKNHGFVTIGANMDEAGQKSLKLLGEGYDAGIENMAWS